MSVNFPGTVVYFSAEDDADLVLFRLFHIAKDMGLTEEEKERVARGFCVIPVMGATGGFRLVIDKFGTCTPTPWVNWVIKVIKEREGVMAIFDPTSLIGAGERSMNDGMAELMKTGNHIGTTAGCSVRFVHHETKSMEQRFDQYSGRGGAAFADNSRSIVQLVSMRGRKQEEFKVAGVDYLVPPELGATTEDYERGRVLGILRHKLTAMELDTTPIFLLRVGFKYSWGMGIPEQSEEGQGIKEAIEAEKAEARQQKLDEGLKPVVLQILKDSGKPMNVLKVVARIKEMNVAGAKLPNDKNLVKEVLDSWTEQGEIVKEKGQREGSSVYRVI